MIRKKVWGGVDASLCENDLDSVGNWEQLMFFKVLFSADPVVVLLISK